MGNVAIVPADPMEPIRFITELPDEPIDNIAQLQKWLGGYFAILAAPPMEFSLHTAGADAPAFYTRDADGVITWDDPIILVDEDGLPKQLPLNVRMARITGYGVVGTALILDRVLWG